MADPTSSTSTIFPITAGPTSPNVPPSLICINVPAQLPIKLSSINYPSWRAQWNSLLIGYDLTGFIDGSRPSPPEFLNEKDSQIQNPAFLLWRRQDQLLLNAILASTSESVQAFVASATTSLVAWTKLETLLANRSRSRVMHLKERLTMAPRGNRPVREYLLFVKSIADELALAHAPLSSDDLVLHILNGVGEDFKELVSALRARETPISFEELHDKLVDYEQFLHRHSVAPISIPTAHIARRNTGTSSNYRNSSTNSNWSSKPKSSESTSPYHHRRASNSGGRPMCQICDKLGHTAKTCYQGKKFFETPPVAHHVAAPSRPTTGVVSPSSHSNWLVDSGASHHVTSDLQNLSLYSNYGGPDEVHIADGTGLTISHTGSATISTPSQSLTLTNVLCVPRLQSNLLSVSQLCRSNNVSIEFFPHSFLIKDLSTGAHLLQGPNKNGVYELSTSPAPSPTAQSALVGVKCSSEVWHRRLGHPSQRVLDQTLSHSSLPVSLSKFSCDSCQCNKSHKLPFSVSSLSTSRPLELLYSDVWGPSPISSIDGFKYYVIFVDHFTKYVWLFPIKNKSDVSSIFTNFKAIVEKYFNVPIKSLYTDGGGEYTKLAHFLASHGISHLSTPPHTPEYNGMSERRHRHVVETGLALLHQASAPLHFWSYAFQTAAYLINRMPTPLLHSKSPFEKLFSATPNYSRLRTFGCLCYPWLKPYAPHKLAPKSTPCIFLGYSTHQSAYKCLDITSGRLYISRHVRFEESIFPFSQRSSPTCASPPLNDTTSDSLTTLFYNIPFHTSSSSSPSSPPPSIPPPSPTSTPDPCSSSSSSPTTTTSSSSPSSPPPSIPPPSLPPAPTRGHSMVTRSKNNIFRPKRLFQATKHPLPPSITPTCISTAIKDPQWRAAMSDEFNALLRNHTWELVPPHPSQNIIGCKWVFRIKRKPDGTIDRYKARLVAKGFHQRPGLDFSETFSPVIKPTTIRLVLCLALSKGWAIKQLDVNNAFLQGTLHDTVFMEQPPGFSHVEYPNHVCRLKKALYGLKQAPRAWYTELSSFLLRYGFRQSASDASLFIYRNGTTTIYFLIYVDDILVTGNDLAHVTSFMQKLSTTFSVKDMGDLHYFLGIEVISTSSGLFLSQHKYIRELLQKFNLDGVNPVSTPLSTTATLRLHDGTSSVDAKPYRQLVGALQYLSLTRPDIGFAVNKLSQFMHSPTQTHWAHLKRLARYLKSTIYHGLFLKRHCPLTLQAFSDADWAGNQDDRTSTTAYVVYLGGNPMSWSSRKQKSVARSSTEAEYRAVATTAAELAWLQNLLHELGVSISSPPTIFCDNVGTTYFCANPVFHSRMKHISLDYHFVRQRVAEGKLVVAHVSSKEQLADVLTKPLSRLQYSYLRSKIGVADGTTILRGRVEDNTFKAISDKASTISDNSPS